MIFTSNTFSCVLRYIKKEAEISPNFLIFDVHIKPTYYSPFFQVNLNNATTKTIKTIAIVPYPIHIAHQAEP